MEWAIRLVPHLSGNARAAFVAMAAEDTSDYKKVKEAILSKYEINEEVYRQRFREPDIRPSESPREFYNRLKDLYNKWIQPDKLTKEQVGEIIIEQFYRSLSPELRVWVKERDPKSAQEAALLVETFLAARRGSKAYRYEPSPKTFPPRGKPSGVGGGSRGLESVKPVEKPAVVKPKVPVCFYCGKEGHIKPECPVRKAKSAYVSTLPRPQKSNIQFTGKQKVTTVVVNGQEARALLDTGSVQTLVHPSIIHRDLSLGKPVLDISCVHGDCKMYPTAEVYLEVAGQTFLVSVGVVASLTHEVILGQDVPILQELVQTCSPVNIVTRSQFRMQHSKDREAVKSQTTPTRQE
ncbi:zinc finger protein 232, partial [Oryzias melastigma]|uniref:zinc finger protein 232 n=1 Tax=Oryzias melastigma TaxID=30732 RepID=UPI000CF7DBA8